LVALGLNVKVSVAGGIKQATVQQVVKAGPDIVVVGGAITGSPAAELASREIRELVDAAA
jgi:3-hexulose-6-phosphate synthase